MDAPPEGRWRPPPRPPSPWPSAEPAPLEDPLPAPIRHRRRRRSRAAPPRRESDTPTQGFPAISRDDEPPEDGDEDVLEETPDFLQDTPEHDRLWFEQKPPRDFDFDG